MRAQVTTYDPAVRRFLATPGRFAVIATAGRDGAPRQAVVWYRLDDEGLLFNSLVGRRWPSALRRDPRLSLTVIDPDLAREIYVTVRGEARLVATGDEALADIQDLARRYGSDPGQYAGQQRISFRLLPHAVTVHGDLA